MGASGSIIASSGEVFVSPELQNMCDKNVTLKTLTIMRRPLGSFGGYQGSKLPILGLGQHEYVIIDAATERFIKAEKFGKSKGRPAGIHIALESDDEATGNCRKKVNLMGVSMQLAELVQILGSPRPDYNLFTNNCWKYAFWTAHNLLGRCIANVGIPFTTRQALQNELVSLLEYDRSSPTRLMITGFVSPRLNI
ncbi:uncharacterized protein [Physcomitrium patens]|uniref:Uncharacterized protein n=1 Tax=Physcomitrium patens TaxID=3218 RepID=A0A2K1L9N8_PHYPA|nr:uncharacterized protein LOC112280320 [Physcomitrium patens]PNR62734.1 hypothetical protein PHYPA_001158 [Physcomitrium patens]|eukprot:XP_024371448.1 uncharacterized protein LOC112280320 [Physcomitrella patens]